MEASLTWESTRTSARTILLESTYSKMALPDLPPASKHCTHVSLGKILSQNVFIPPICNPPRYSTATKSISNRFMHLTNYSVNKKNSSFTANSDETVCQGHKWYVHITFALNALVHVGTYTLYNMYMYMHMYTHTYMYNLFEWIWGQKTVCAAYWSLHLLPLPSELACTSSTRTCTVL